MMIADIEIQKVSHRSLPQPVPEIAECSTQNQAERNGNRVQSVSAFPEQIANHRARRNRKADQTCCCQGELESAKMLNAAPVFSQCESWNRPGTMEISCATGIRLMTSSFVVRSSRITAAAIRA